MKDYDKWRTQYLQAAEGNFARALKLMRSRDPQKSEDGFSLLQSMAGKNIQELIDEYRRGSDLGNRYWLLELIGTARSPEAFDFLATKLTDDDESVRFLAAEGLQQLNTKEARRLLSRYTQPRSGPQRPP